MHPIQRYRKPIIGIFFVLTLASAFLATKLKFSNSINNFFPKDDPEMEFLEVFKTQIEPDDLFLLVAIDHGKSVFDTTFLQKVAHFTNEAKKLPYIQDANSITSLKDVLKTPFGYTDLSLVHPDGDSITQINDREKLLADPRFINGLISEDGTILNVVMKTDKELITSQEDQINRSLDSLLAKYNFNKTYISGKANTQPIFLKRVQFEFLFYISISIIIVTITLFLIYGTFWGIVIPLFSVIISLILFLGYYQIMGLELDIMGTMYPTLMLIFCMSDIIHLQSKYLDELNHRKDKTLAFRLAMKEIGIALLLTSVTTAIGFFTLYTSNIIPIKNFGIQAGVGVMIAFVTVYLFSAAALSFFDGKMLSKNVTKFRFWHRQTKRFVWIYEKKRKLSLAIFAIITAISIYGASQVSTNSFLLGDVPKDDKLRSDFNFIEQHLGGVRSYELAILPKAPYTIWSAHVIQATDLVSNFLYDTLQIRAILAPNILVKTLNKAENGGSLDALKLPEDTTTLNRFIKQIEKRSRGNTSLVSADALMGRISGKIKDPGSEVLEEMYAQVNAFIAQNIDPEIVSFRHTGTGLMVDRNHEYLRKNLIQSLLLAFGLIAIIFSVLFKSWKMIVITLIVNIFPLIFTAGVMGFIGIELKAMSAIIFTVSFGIALDDTIHFLVRYRLQRKNGVAPDIAIKQTLSIAGKAMMLSTIVLIAGFISLTFSQFTSTYYVGMLITITLVAALITDLILLPILMRAFEGIKEEKVQ